MNNSGLKESELELILSLIRKYSLVTKAVIFGSRAKGNSKPFSDIDIAIYGLTGALQVEQK